MIVITLTIVRGTLKWQIPFNLKQHGDIYRH